ncbi:MAG TPA: hypothetical protein VF342_13110 [Alphaproteobacteria bacterium]
MMLLLVFMAVTYTFLARSEDLREVPQIQKELEEAKAYSKRLEERIASLEQQLAQAIAERDRAKAQAEEFRRTLERLLPAAQPPRPNPEPMVVITEARLNEMQAKTASLEKIAKELQAENAALRQRLGGKAPGLPRCIVTSRYLLEIILLPDGTFSGTPAWDASAAPIASTLPGIERLASGRPLSAREFRDAAGELNGWADAQEQPCRFAVLARRETTDINLFESQLSTIEAFFYVKRAK